MYKAWYSILILMLPGLATGQSWLAGGGVESDSGDGLQISGFGSVAVGESTWLSATLASSRFELPTGRDSETSQWALDLDHHFDPVGVRVGVAYWGDEDVLESSDWSASVYFRNEAVTLAAEYEFRDFDFTIEAQRLPHNPPRIGGIEQAEAVMIGMYFVGKGICCLRWGE